MRKDYPRKRLQAFQATRMQHQTEAADDYTELIADLFAEQGEARVGTIAAHLGITHVTALRTLRRLQQSGYVNVVPYKFVTLTPKDDERRLSPSNATDCSSVFSPKSDCRRSKQRLTLREPNTTLALQRYSASKR